MRKALLQSCELMRDPISARLHARDVAPSRTLYHAYLTAAGRTSAGDLALNLELSARQDGYLARVQERFYDGTVLHEYNDW